MPPLRRAHPGVPGATLDRLGSVIEGPVLRIEVGVVDRAHVRDTRPSGRHLLSVADIDPCLIAIRTVHIGTPLMHQPRSLARTSTEFGLSVRPGAHDVYPGIPRPISRSATARRMNERPLRPGFAPKRPVRFPPVLP